MFNELLTVQKKLHAERIGELIQEVIALPNGTFKDDNTAHYIAHYLMTLQNELNRIVREESK